MKIEYSIATLFTVLIISYFILVQVQEHNISKQKITLNNIHGIVAAIEVYKEKYGEYPKQGTIGNLIVLLQPFSNYQLFAYDGWQRPLKYETEISNSDKGKVKTFYIGSPGKDGKWEFQSLKMYHEAIGKGYASDIVYSNGKPVKWPEGAAWS